MENLLDWSRIQTGKIKVSPGNFDLNSLIQQIIGIFQINASEKKINIDTCIEPCLKTFADKDLVDTVVRNLLSNAIKFTRPGGNIRIQAFTHDGYVEVGVSDNGIGILPENLSKLFRIDETVSTEGTARETGTGLGLVLCKEFIEKNGGKISVESKMNEGSKFSFTLPGAKD